MFSRLERLDQSEVLKFGSVYLTSERSWDLQEIVSSGFLYDESADSAVFCGLSEGGNYQQAVHMARMVLIRRDV